MEPRAAALIIVRAPSTRGAHSTLQCFPFFFLAPAHRVRAKNLSQRPAHRVRIVHLFWSSLPCERALGGGAAASKLQPCTPSNQPPGSVFIDPLDAALWGG